MMTKVSVYDVGAGTYQLWVYVGGETAPRTLVCTQNMNFTGSHNWHHENLFTAVEIPDNEPIWVVIGQQGLSRPAAACADMGNPNGRWVSLNGSDWVDLLHYNLHYTWMVRAFVTNRSGKVMALGREGLSLQQFNLYRSVNNTDYQKVASIPYDEATTFYQYRDPLVGATCDRYYYRLTAFYQSDDGHECESEYAASLLHPEEDFVMVDDVLGVADFQFDAIKVYPNPASSQLQVEADGMQRVSIYNALGQCVISEKLAKDETQLDFSDLPNGLYLLKVETKNGVASRRFVVAH